MNKLIDGIKVSEEIKKEIKSEIDFFISSGERRPSLSIVLVGKHSASKIYVKAKMKACKEVGINANLISLSDNISQKDLLILIEKLNNKKTEDGFIVQLPLPDHISVQKVIDSIDSNKDIDGFTNDNIGSITSKKKKLMPATGLGVLTLIERYKIDIVSIESAIKNLKTYLSFKEEWITLDEIIRDSELQSSLNQKSFIASTFSASLELAKRGEIELDQSNLFDRLSFKLIL